MVPVILFCQHGVFLALAGGFAGLAFICGITIPVIHATGYDPLMLMIIEMQERRPEGIPGCHRMEILY